MRTLVLAATLWPTTASAEPTAEEVVMSPIRAEDPHLWLEAIDGDAALAKVRTWNERTKVAFEADPRFAQFKAEALEILTSDARIPSVTLRGDQAEGLWRDETNVRGAWRTTSIRSYRSGEPDWQVLLDVDALDAAEQQNWLWHGVTCASGGDRCMVELSRGGKDASVHREFSRTSRTFVAGGFVLPEAKSDVAWLDADTLLVGTDRGEGTMTDAGYPRTVVTWERGTALADAPVIFEGEPTDVASSPRVLHHGDETVALLVRSPTFYDNEVFWLRDGATTRLELPLQSDVQGLFGRSLLVLLREDWAVGGAEYRAGSLVAYDLDRGAVSLAYAPPELGSIESVAIGKTSVFVSLLDNVVGRVVRLTQRRGEFRSNDIGLPPNGVVAIAASSDERDDVFVSFESLTVPSTLFYVSAKDEVRAMQSLPSFYDASDIIVEQRFATSSDGTKVPYFLMARRDVLAAGPAPTIQYGYGGFLAAILPSYFSEEARPQHGALAGKIWVSRGGVLVLSNIRGGSEYGPAWHAAALKENRQLAYDDFFAIGDALVKTGVTTPAQLGAVGRSNGGLLMGVALTQRPDLYAAIDCGVPLLDMMRYHTLLAGSSWIAEYGDPEIPEERAVLAKYSPYQNLREGVEYPTVLFYTSTRDDRVHPGHARKMAAKLESMGVPFEYYENTEGGHGGVSNQPQAAWRIALEYTYFARQLGLGDAEP